MKLHFSESLDGTISVETWKDDRGLDYTTLGQLEFNQEQKAWIFWPEDLSCDGVTYFDDLEETESTIQDEYTESEAEKDMEGSN